LHYCEQNEVLPACNQTFIAQAFKLITEWVNAGTFGEVEIPADIAANNNRRKFLIELTEAEGSEWLRSKKLPPEKSTIPEGWKKGRKEKK